MSGDSISRILEVEARHPELNSVTVNGIPIWPYLRKVWHSYWVAEDQGLPVRSKFSALSQLKSVFYGITAFLKPASVICFTDATLRKPLDGKYVDKNFQGIVEHFGPDNVLLVERLSHSAVSHKSHSACATKRLCSYSTLLALSMLWRSSKLKIKGWDMLKAIAKQENVNVDHTYIFRNVYAQYRVAKWFLKWKKPEKVFVNCYYGKPSVIRAAKELGIPVIEVQHGLIRHEDPSYFSSVDLDTSLLPDTLLTFGTQEVEVLSKEGAIIKPKNCIPFGSYMMEAVVQKETNNELVAFINNYDRTIAVSGQEGDFESEAVEMVNTFAKQHPDWGIIYVPRMVALEKPFYKFEKNVWCCTTHNIYDVIRHCDIHATVYSTCALEAGSLGKPTVFINCRGLSEQYLKSLMPEAVVLGYARSAEELYAACNVELKASEVYRAANAPLFVPDQKKALKTVFPR
jgi:hypothetical protein